MYHQLTSEQRSQISALLQNRTPRKEIAKIVGISQSTISRDLKRNSCRNGRHYMAKGSGNGNGASGTHMSEPKDSTIVDEEGH